MMRKVKFVIAALALLCLIGIAIPTNSYAEASGDYEYKVLENGTIEITDYTGTDTELEIPAEIDGYTVTGIGSNAFMFCGKLKSVKLPESIVYIASCVYDHDEYFTDDELLYSGKGAFGHCGNLKNIELNVGLKIIGDSAFYGCAIEDIVIPGTVEYIGGYAFEGNKLKEITIPDSVSELGGYAFIDCPLETAYIGKGVSKLNGSFWGSGINHIEVDGDNACYADIDGVLTNKDKTELIYFPEKKQTDSYTIPDGITGIGEKAFSNSSYLKSITISKYVSKLNADSLNCDNLQQIYVSDKNNKFTVSDGVLFNKEKNKLILYPSGNTRTAYTIPEGIIEIGPNAFECCRYLQNITFNSNLKTIGEYAFNKCNSIKSISLKGKITNMGNQAFGYCGSLEKVTLGNQVTVIGDRAFAGCTSLTKIDMGDRVKKIGSEAFYMCRKLPSIKIPNTVIFIGAKALHSEGEWVNGEPFEEFVSKKIGTINYAGSKSEWKKIDGASQYTPKRYNYCTKAGVTHSYKKMLTKATRFHDGSYDTRCSKCGNIKAKISTIYKIDSIKLSYAKAKYNGKTKTPVVTVKNSNGKKLVKGTDYTVKYESGRQKVGTYTVTVTFKGKYYGTVKRYFDIVPKATAIKSLTKGASQITVKWQKVTKQISGYQIRYSIVQNMADAEMVSVKNYKTTSKTIKNLDSGRKYYVQVRVYKNVGGKTYYGNWSPKKKVAI